MIEIKIINLITLPTSHVQFIVPAQCCVVTTWYMFITFFIDLTLTLTIVQNLILQHLEPCMNLRITDMKIRISGMKIGVTRYENKVYCTTIGINLIPHIPICHP